MDAGGRALEARASQYQLNFYFHDVFWKINQINRLVGTSLGLATSGNPGSAPADSDMFYLELWYLREHNIFIQKDLKPQYGLIE